MVRFFVVAIIFVFGQSFLRGEEALWVELDHEQPLLPLYLSGVDLDGAPFSENYLNSLHKVLEFDLGHSGYCQIVSGNKNVKEAAIKKWRDDPLYGTLSPLEAYFLVRPHFKDKKLSVDLVAITSMTHKKLEGIVLSGNISKDRAVLHTLADRILKEFFDVDGINTTKILFTIKKNGENRLFTSEVYESDWDGENLRQVSQGAGYIVNPAYVPPQEGRRAGFFFFVSYQNGQPKLFYSSLNPFSPQRFITLKGNQLMPAISRQRDAVAFITDATGNPDLFLQPIESTGKPVGKPSQIYSTFKATQGTPSFSPDGKEIAFVSNKDGSPRIYVMKRPEPGASLKSLQAKLLSKSSRENTAPNWSPDGKKIVFSAMTDGIRQIWIYDFDKQKERQLTHGGGHKENPVFAPDSLHIVFNGVEKGKSELYVINLHESKAVKKDPPKKEASPPGPKKPTQEKEKEEKKKALLQKARSALAKASENSTDIAQSSSDIALPKKLTSLDSALLPQESSKSLTPGERNYRDELRSRLQLNLVLPESGIVEIKLTLTRGGKCKKVEIIKGKSQENRKAVETLIPTLYFPPFGAHFPGEESHTFLITLTSD